MSHRLSDSIGSVLSFTSTVLFVRASILAWPAGLLAICVDLYLYYKTGLYADMAKESIYFVSMFYGWYEWLRGGKGHTALPITQLTLVLARKLALIAVAAIGVTILLLIRFTNSQVPYWDATTTVLSLTAQWLTCRKIMECWILWFVTDSLYTGLYFYKMLPWHGFLFLVYLGCAVAGYWRWSVLKSRQSQELALSLPDGRGSLSSE